MFALLTLLALVLVFSILWALLAVPADYIITKSRYLSQLLDWEGGSQDASDLRQSAEPLHDTHAPKRS